ncbi:membrane protein [Petrotoga sibirica DSM 13575]|uniref:Membrane protein n=1 Tax=Petrotoga sibirica DSM 13575 TaxID=1122956 RepID=A0A855MLX4_9BACT|nr:AI-2E family transporter [Petrotoga sibirica]POZ88504.1 membrane protein [Petrotoga sibirica DSM 13575]POZ91352.1 membrane protein [Petrotoga sp. SL27]
MSLIYLGIFLLLSYFSPFIISALILGVFLSMLIEAPQNLFSKFMNSKLSALLSHVLVLGLVLYAAITFFPLVINEGRKLFSMLSSLTIPQEEAMAQLPEWLVTFINDLNKNLSDFALGLMNQLLSSIPNLITSAIVLVVTTTAIGSLKKITKNNLWKLYPVNDREKGLKFMKDTYSQFERFVHGQFLAAIIVGTFIGLMSFLFRIPSAFFLGILAWITDFIPYLGVVISAVPLLMLAFTENGLVGLIIGIAILTTANQLEMWFLQPKIQSNALNLHWFVIIISILLFGDLFSFLGIFIALPIVVYLRNFWEYFVIKIK